MIFTTTSGKRSWERKKENSTVQLAESLKDIVMLNAEHLLFIWSSGASESLVVCSFLSLGNAKHVRRKKRFFLEPTKRLFYNGISTALQRSTSTSSLQCKLQVTPRSRGLYQNKGHMWGGRAECGLGPTGRSLGPTKTVAPGAVLTRPILIFFNPAWELMCCNCGLGMMCIGNEKQPTLPIENCITRWANVKPLIIIGFCMPLWSLGANQV